MGKKGKRKQASETDKKVSAVNKEVLGLCQQILEVVSTDFSALPAAQWEEFEKIYGIVEKIQEKQKDEGIQWEGHSREAHIDDFTKWFKDNGGIADNVEIYNFGEEGLGLRATSDIKVNEVYVTVPQKIMMTVESARTSELGPLISRDRVLMSMQHVTLALHILCEKLREDASPWKHYLDILPSEYGTSLYYTPMEMKMLQGSPSLGDALKPYRSIAKHYAYFFRLFQTTSTPDMILRKSFTFNDFRWAVSTVMTRQNQVPVSDTQSIKALIPMWDMCNHCNGTITTGLDSNEKACKSLAMRTYQAGEQVSIFYGIRNTADLLFHNGFVFPENNNDWVNIPLGVSRNDRLYAMKAQIMAMIGLEASARQYQVLRGPDPISPELRTFLRIFAMNEDELKIRLFNPERKPVAPLSELANASFILSQDNEKKCWSFLYMRLQLILGQYKTTDLEEDNLSANARNCIKLRAIEKDILNFAMEHAKAMLDRTCTDEEKPPPVKEEMENREDAQDIESKANLAEDVVEVSTAMNGVTINENS